MTPKRHRGGRIALAVLAVAMTVGCGTDGPLQGSLSELFSLEVSAEVIQRNPDAFQVTYLLNRATGEDVVVSMSVALAGIGFIPGATFDLSGEYATGHQRTTVIHHADGEPERALPDISRGTMTLGSGGDINEGTAGKFSVAFVDDGTSYGSGRTLLGSFEGIAMDAGF